MRRIFAAVAVTIGIVVLAVLAHMAFIEIGREVVTLRTPRADGSWQATRLWIVDDGGSAWVHSGGPAWKRRFDGDPTVELERRQRTYRCRAHAVPGPHPEIHRLLREKYGLADRWVRFLGPDKDDTLVVRLDCDETQ